MGLEKYPPKNAGGFGEDNPKRSEHTMPINLERLRQPRRVAVAVTLSEAGADGQMAQTEETFDVTYRPLSPRLLGELHALAEEGAEAPDAVVMARQMARLLVGVELLDDDGQPMEPTAENLSRVPVEILQRIFTAITADAGGERQEAAG
jgi:hypothetical protein